MEQFGKYTLIRKIGTGGMAEVFLARTPVAQGLQKTLVIKKIHPAYAKSRQFVAMFVDEAKIALGLNHPNIIQVFDFGAVGDTYFLAMEHVEGIDLLRLLQEAARARVRLPYGISAYIVQQVAKGLDYAHRKTDEFGEPLSIVHRDISPQNVLVSWDGAVKIVDFGIARARDVHEEEGVIKGKFAYMSPEQARGEPVDRRSDVFAAGIVLYELVCARPLFSGKGSGKNSGKGKAVLELAKAGAIPRPRDFAPELPDSLERVMVKALAFHRADRYQTARDLQHELGRFQLDWGAQHATLIDSSALAQQLASVVSPELRAKAPRPPAEAAEAGGESSTRARSPSPAPYGSVTPVARPEPQTRERKYVYVLEGMIRGIPALERRVGPAEAARLVDAFYQVARDIAFKHDAVAVDGVAAPEGIHSAQGDFVRSGTLRAVVGLPVAGEADASRSIRLALALVDALDGIGSDVEPELRLGLAVQRGAALVWPRRDPKASLGPAGQPAGAFFDLEDATVAFAHKLARQARGAEILVGGRVFRAARADWVFEALAAIDVPDDATARAHVSTDDETDPGVKRARVYRLRGPKARALRLRDRGPGTRLFGRELELKALRDAWRDVVGNKKKRQLVIVGDTGVGKRTLVRAFLDELSPDEATVVRTSARVGTAMTPYGVIADLARDVLGLADDAEPHEVERRLLRALALFFPGEEDSPDARGALEVFAMLLGARGIGPRGPDDADARRGLLARLIARIESRLGGDKPVVLVGEDMHWADQDSQELFANVLALGTPRPLFGLMTSRPEPRILALAKRLGTEVVLLDELGAAERREMIASRFAPGEDISDLLDQIGARAGGNAFFIQELLDMLIERGVLVAEAGAKPDVALLRWVKRDAPIAVPSTIEDLILARIDALPAPERSALVHAAVLGRHVAAAALADLLGKPVRLELDELVRRGLLSSGQGPGSGGDEYRFKNDMTMTIAYALVPPDTRGALHRAAAARIAGAAGYRSGQDDALIARHLELAGDAADAADRYLRAATHAASLGGNADAFRQLGRALELLPEGDHERRFAAHRLREEILRRLAKRPQQLRELHALRNAADATRDPKQQAIAHAALAQFYIDVGKAAAALRAAVPALQYARDAGDVLGEAEALRLRSAVAQLVGNVDESLRLVEDALALVEPTSGARPHGTPSAVLVARATILDQKGTTLWNLGRLEPAIESYAEGLVIYRALGLARQEARALHNMGLVFAALGEYEEALAHYKSALKIDQALGERSGVAVKLGNIGRCYADLGDLERAEGYLRRALAVAEQTGERATTSDVAVSLGQVLYTRGDFAGALALFERGLAVATEARERYHEVRALEYAALAHLASGDPPDAALDMARSATEWARKMPMLVGLIYGLTFQGLALAKLGRHAEAVAVADEALALVETARLASPADVGRAALPEAVRSMIDGVELVYRWRAEILAAAGRAGDAATALARADGEIAAKAERLRDPELRRMYLAAHRM